MNPIVYIDRLTKKKEQEKIYKEEALRFLYGDSFLSRIFRPCLLPIVSKWSLFSKIYGYFQKTRRSSKKIKPFIKAFQIDTSEFLEALPYFRSFNDFFIRKLKPKARPINDDPSIAIIPADGRYYFFDHIDQCLGFIVKGQKFDLADLLKDASLASEYQQGSMVLGRLCPSDYHRFHFPCECVPGPTRILNGWLSSVNPLAVKKNIRIFSENKRGLCELETSRFGRVLYLEIGATNVGSIRETYTPSQPHRKGSEKGYFEFGGSALILLFQKETISFDQDLLAATLEGFEIRCLLGQSMGKALKHESKPLGEL